MKNILIVSHYIRFLLQFELDNVRILQEMGYRVNYATNYMEENMYEDAKEEVEKKGVILHQVDFVRSPYNVRANIKAFHQLRQLMEEEHFDGVDCHTPMAGAIARMAAHATDTMPVIYTAHGFHFYKGCSIQNKLIYKNAERFLAKYTDALLTINHEDFSSAQKFRLRGKAYYIPGVGVDVDRISTLKPDKTCRKQLGIPEDAFVFASTGELNKNKNHETTIKAFKKAAIPNSYYIICGAGELRDYLNDVICRENLENRVLLLGFRTDVATLLNVSNVFLFPSIREGLGLAAVEAMAAGLPVIAADNRGSRELAQNGWDGILCEANNIEAFASEMKKFYLNYSGKSETNVEAARNFDIKTVDEKMRTIYHDVLDSREK